MSRNPPIFSRNTAGFPIYIQEDAYPAIYNALKGVIHDCEGLVRDAPENALAICITNRNTPLGANLIAKYYQADTSSHRRGVVDYRWVFDCVDAGALLGPPSWGGHYISPLTMEHFFSPSPANVAPANPSCLGAPSRVGVYHPGTLPPPESHKRLIEGEAHLTVSWHGGSKPQAVSTLSTSRTSSNEANEKRPEGHRGRRRMSFGGGLAVLPERAMNYDALPDPRNFNSPLHEEFGQLFTSENQTYVTNELHPGEEETNVSEYRPSAGPSSRLPKALRRRKKSGKRSRGPVLAYTQKEIYKMAKVVEENPDQPLAPLFATFAKARVDARSFPQRSGAAYSQYYRNHPELFQKLNEAPLALSQSAPHIKIEFDNDVSELGNNFGEGDCHHATRSNQPERTSPRYIEEALDRIVVAENSPELVDLGAHPRYTGLTSIGRHNQQGAISPERGHHLLGTTEQRLEDNEIPAQYREKKHTANLTTQGYLDEGFSAAINSALGDPKMSQTVEPAMKEGVWSGVPSRSPEALTNQIKKNSQGFKELDGMPAVARSAQPTPDQILSPSSSAGDGKLLVLSAAKSSRDKYKRARGTHEDLGSPGRVPKKLKESSPD
ncbi:hypothetical protein FRB90_000816 [Tulasnella sp. 427]|nr:hypothetical protein FRB90_000816 [Tulasnella sp. 427]